MRDRRRALRTLFVTHDREAVADVDTCVEYAPVLFSQAGLSSTTSAFLASGVSGLLNIACTIITQIFTDNCESEPPRSSRCVLIRTLGPRVRPTQGAAAHR